VLAMRKTVQELEPEEKKMFLALISGEDLPKSK
jgi:hypothetical protein